MPELPEVEVVRRGLQQWAVGREIASVEVRHPRAVRRHLPGGADLAARLAGQRLAVARRRGKYLWLPLQFGVRFAASADDVGEPTGEALVAHLGMSGQLLVQPEGAPAGPHLRVRFRFADGDPELRFVDQRTFGGLAIEPLDPVPDSAEPLPASLRHIARDPLDPDFDDAGFLAALRRRRTGLKRALLDQALASGIGNIYADEALWRARLHYARPTETLTRAEAVRLLVAVREVLTDALARGGTSFDSLYVDVNGRSGWFARELAVYGRAGQPCPRCGTPVRRDPFMNRSSHTCPHCQPRQRRARW